MPRRIPTDERGAAAVEFALILSVLMMLVFGILEYGRVYSELEVLESAAREGARVAAVGGSFAEVQDAVTAASAGHTLSSGLSVTECQNDGSPGETTTVGWTQSFQIDIALLPPLDAARDIRGVFRCEV